MIHALNSFHFESVGLYTADWSLEEIYFFEYFMYLCSQEGRLITVNMKLFQQRAHLKRSRAEKVVSLMVERGYLVQMDTSAHRALKFVVQKDAIMQALRTIFPLKHMSLDPGRRDATWLHLRDKMLEKLFNNYANGMKKPPKSFNLVKDDDDAE